MKIGELACKADCTTETIRYYEKTGLLPNAIRTNNNYRHYETSHLERLRFIRNCRSLEMSHDEIRELIDMMTKDKNLDVHSKIHHVLSEHLTHIEQRIDNLTALKKSLKLLQSQCGANKNKCTILNDITELKIDVKNNLSHL